MRNSFYTVSYTHKYIYVYIYIYIYIYILYFAKSMNNFVTIKYLRNLIYQIKHNMNLVYEASPDPYVRRLAE